jgi:hypothetical protein
VWILTMLPGAVAFLLCWMIGNANQGIIRLAAELRIHR